MSLAWSGDFNQTREDDIERVLDEQDRKLMEDPVLETPQPKGRVIPEDGMEALYRAGLR